MDEMLDPNEFELIATAVQRQLVIRRPRATLIMLCESNGVINLREGKATNAQPYW